MAHYLLRRGHTGTSLAGLRANIDRERRHTCPVAHEFSFRTGDRRLTLVEDGQPQLHRWSNELFAAGLAFVGNPNPERAQVAQLLREVQCLSRGVRALLGCRKIETLGYGLRFDLLQRRERILERRSEEHP